MTTTEPPAVGNRYLEGVFAPVVDELTAVDLPVTGTIPAELDGRYLRNGPNPIGEVDPATYHWFTGDGMVHGIRLRDGKAEWYRNRWVRSTKVSEALGESPATGVRGFFDNPNTNVIGQAGRTFAIVEAGAKPAELSDELETLCHSDLDGTLPNGFSAHPKKDPATGKLHTIGYFWGRPEVLEYTVVGTDARVEHRVDIPVPGNPMTHDCSITETTLAVYDMPVTFNVDAAMSGVSFPYIWDDDYGARIGLMPLGGQPDDVQWFEVEPCYVFHPVNAHDVDGGVVIDVVRHPKMFDRDRTGPNDGPSAVWRWTFDRASGKVREEQLDDRPVELPRVDERLVGRPHRWSWAPSVPVITDGIPPDVEVPLVRYDGQTGAAETISFGRGRGAGEAVFVPRTPESAEDDGWLMTIVVSTDRSPSELVILDASAPGEGPVATVHLPAHVPLGFHGNWIPTGS